MTRSPVRDAGAVGRDDVGRRVPQQHGALGQLGGQRADEVAGEVLDPAERPADGAAEQRRGGRVGPEEAGRGAHQLAVDDEVVERDVVPAEAPAPGAAVARLAEHAQVVEARVATALAVEPHREALDLVEDVLQPDDRRDGDVRRGPTARSRRGASRRAAARAAARGRSARRGRSACRTSGAVRRRCRRRQGRRRSRRRAGRRRARPARPRPPRPCGERPARRGLEARGVAHAGNLARRLPCSATSCVRSPDLTAGALRADRPRRPHAHADRRTS